MTETANSRQVGGSHYKKGDGDQHWDIVDRYGVPYLEGVGSKYPLRWREKGGVEDLEKTLHYIDKILESPSGHRRWQRHLQATTQLHLEISALCARHDCTGIEQEVVATLMAGSSADQLRRIRHVLSEYILALRRDEAATVRPLETAVENVVVHHHHTHIVMPEGSNGEITQVGDLVKAQWSPK